MVFYFVYVLQSKKDNSLYIGFTSRQPEIRLHEHNNGESTFTKAKAPYRLIYYEAYTVKTDALGREKFLKGGSGRKYLYKQLRRHFTKNPTAGFLKTSLR